MTKILAHRAAKLAAMPTLSSPRSEPPSATVPEAIAAGGAQVHRNVGKHRTTALTAASGPGPTKRSRHLDGHLVSELFYETVHGRVTDVLPILSPGEHCDAADLCGSTFMARLRPAGRRDVGLCLADMAARGALPLTPVLDDADGPPRYRLVGGAR
jgi:hypothetical protein